LRTVNISYDNDDDDDDDEVHVSPHVEQWKSVSPSFRTYRTVREIRVF